MVETGVAALFDGWDEALIWSCLQGHMGTMLVERERPFDSAIIDIGDFCFCAGRPNKKLLGSIEGGKLLVPKDAAWEACIEAVFAGRVKKINRYAMKKEPDIFNREKLSGYVRRLAPCYELKRFNQEIFDMARSESWSADLCARFRDYADFQSRGAIGTAILHQGELVAGASPYAVYDSGIEIEIDTKPTFRRQGLATVCGAKLILDCLDAGIYPSWDAHDLRSVALAEKLGYHLSYPYVAYALSDS